MVKFFTHLQTGGQSTSLEFGQTILEFIEKFLGLVGLWSSLVFATKNVAPKFGSVWEMEPRKISGKSGLVKYYD